MLKLIGVGMALALVSFVIWAVHLELGWKDAFMIVGGVLFLSLWVIVLTICLMY